MEFETPGRPLRNDEYPDEPTDELDEDELSESVVCSHCGQWVYEDAVQCPSCGNYVESSRNIMAGKPLWYILLAVAGIIALITTLALMPGY